ncbi:MAG: ABC transporter permease [Anaerolineae bacterium]|nr:ABC transporter permease [Anaerolineae bacterium]
MTATLSDANTQRTQVSRLGFRSWLIRQVGEAKLAVGLFIVLLIVNVILNPARFRPENLGTVIGLAAPLILAALATTPVILSGRGGIDISVGPLMGLLNVIIVQYMYLNMGISSPFLIIPIALLIGALSGTINGIGVAVIHIQPIVATLSTYLIYTGLTLGLLPAPTGSVPPWLASLSGPMSIVPIIVVIVLWTLLRRTPYYEHLMATGGDDRAAYSSGVPVTWVRLIAYVLTGIFAAIASLSLTGLLGSGDPNVGPNYTLTAIAAVALGGVSLAGGMGGMFGALLGALDIFLLQTMLTFFNVSTFLIQIAYGIILIIAISLNAGPVRNWLGSLGRSRA